MPIRGPQSSGTDSVATHQRTKSAGQTQKLQTRTKVVAHTGPTNGSEDYDWNKQGIGQTKVFMACHERTSTRSRYSAELMKCLLLFFFQKLGMKKRIYANVSLSQNKANQWALKVVPIPWMDSAHVISAFAQGVQLHPGVFRHWCVWIHRHVACEYWSVRIFVFKFSTKGAFRVFNAIMKLVWCQESCYKQVLKSRRTFVELIYI